MEPDEEEIGNLWNDVSKQKEAAAKKTNLDDPNDSQYQYSATGNDLMRDLNQRNGNPNEGGARSTPHKIQSKRSHSPASSVDSRKRSRTHYHSSHSRRSPSHGHHSKHTSERRHHSSHRHNSSRRSRSRSRSATRSRSSSRSPSDGSRATSPGPAGNWYNKVSSAQVESSWVSRVGKRGTRSSQVLGGVGGKKAVKRTSIEEKKTREAKFQHIRANGHWYGRIFKFRFNPYTKDESLAKDPKRMIFPRPFTQPGRGGNSLQKAIGLTDDRDFYNDILESLRGYCDKYGPEKRSEEGQNWLNLPARSKATIQAKSVQTFPFLSHFCDKDGDSWAVKMMAQTYLGGSKSYKKRKLSSSGGVRQTSPARNNTPPPGPDNSHIDPPSEHNSPAPPNQQNRRSTRNQKPNADVPNKTGRSTASNQAAGPANSTQAADRRKAARTVEREVERAKRLEEAEREQKKADAEAAKKNGKAKGKEPANKTTKKPNQKQPSENEAGPSNRATGARKARPVPVRYINNGEE